jgi:transposase-like protein
MQLTEQVARDAAAWRAAQVAADEARDQLAATVRDMHSHGVSIYRLAKLVDTDPNTIKRWLKDGAA